MSFFASIHPSGMHNFNIITALESAENCDPTLHWALWENPKLIAVLCAHKHLEEIIACCSQQEPITMHSKGSRQAFNDLPDNIRSSVRLFADDCVLYRNIYSIQGCLTLQEDLTSLEQWEAGWQMIFNVAKCHSMRVTRHQHHKHILFDYSLHNQTLESVQSAKYLGITIPDNISYVTCYMYIRLKVDLLCLCQWIGVSTFQKFLPKQLRHLVSQELGFCT